MQHERTHVIFHVFIVFSMFVLRLVQGAIPVVSNSNVVCAPASWQSILAFFALNYGTHAMTVKSFPGDTKYTTILWIVFSLLIPFAGVGRGCQLIARGMSSTGDDIQGAARSGALCVVMRNSKWAPREGEAIEGCRIVGTTSAPAESIVTATLRVEDVKSRKVNLSAERIHGQIIGLEDEYELRILPSDVKVVPRHAGKSDICQFYNVLKYLASLLQVGYACVTLYRVRGDQVEKYGYAAFGLTVLPYAVMSIINLLANIVTPEYPTLYLVRSEVMDEAESRGCKFDGVIGTIIPGKDTEEFKLSFEAPDQEHGGVRFRYPGLPNQELSQEKPSENLEVVVSGLGRHVEIQRLRKSKIIGKLIAAFIGIIALITPYVVIAIITKFRNGQSTASQRGWTMAWLVYGQLFGSLMWLGSLDDSVLNPHDVGDWISASVAIALAATPAIGGFVVVGKMLSDFGSCELVS